VSFSHLPVADLNLVQARRPDAESAQDFLLAAAMQGERGMAVARISGLGLFLAMLCVNVATGVRPPIVLAVAGLALSIGIGWSFWLLRLIRQGRLREQWVVLSAVMDGLVATVALWPTVWWPRPDYQGFASQPTAAAFLVALATIPLRLSARATWLGVTTMLGGCALLVVLDYGHNGARASSFESATVGAILMVTAAAVAAVTGHWVRATVQRGMDAARHGEQARSRLGAYLSPEIAREVMELTRGPVRRQQERAAVLFSDLRGFTLRGESLTPAELIAELNAYFEVMVAAVQAHGGVVDKFMGDALMAVFGVPRPMDDCAGQAVRAAAAMDLALQQHNRDRAARGLPPLQHGIGVHVGVVVAGDVGTASRRQYTVIGDTVNVASRIEALTKQFQRPVLLSGDVVDGLRDGDPLRDALQPVGDVEIRGRVGRIQLWSVGEPSAQRRGEA
jgi:class 3 adenylate cyclase